MRDEYWKRACQAKGEREMLLLSLLPCLGMLQKLLSRKEHGKKPFSPQFDYEERIKEIESCRHLLQEGKGDVLSVLKPLPPLCDCSCLEIKTQSLREDILWLKRSFECAILLLEEEKEKKMKHYEEWKDRDVLIDLRNRFATCYRNPDGSVFYIEPQFYTYLQGYKMLRPESYQKLLDKMDEIVKKNRKVVFVGQDDNPLVETEGAIYLSAMDIADLCKVLVEDKSRGSDYGD